MGPRDVGTIEEPWSVLAGLAEQAAGENLLNRGLGVAALLGACERSFRSLVPSRDLDGYIGAQVRGGVSLESDVESVVLDPSFRGTGVETDLRAAAERYGFSLTWHTGSELHCDQVPDDFRGPTMPVIAEEVARPDGVVDAHAIGLRAASVAFAEPTVMGDDHESDLQQLKYLWHTLLAHGHDAPMS
jgi:GNAT superfamily N-acetyltransferase